VFFPLALVGLVYVIGAVAELISPPEGPREFGLFSLIIGVIFIGADYSAISSARETQRRLKLLREDPTQNIRPMPAGFLTGLFR